MSSLRTILLLVVVCLVVDIQISLATPSIEVVCSDNDMTINPINMTSADGRLYVDGGVVNASCYTNQDSNWTSLILSFNSSDCGAALDTVITMAYVETFVREDIMTAATKWDAQCLSRVFNVSRTVVEFNVSFPEVAAIANGSKTAAPGVPVRATLPPLPDPVADLDIQDERAQRLTEAKIGDPLNLVFRPVNGLVLPERCIARDVSGRKPDLLLLENSCPASRLTQRPQSTAGNSVTITFRAFAFGQESNLAISCTVLLCPNDIQTASQCNLPTNCPPVRGKRHALADKNNKEGTLTRSIRIYDPNWIEGKDKEGDEELAKSGMSVMETVGIWTIVCIVAISAIVVLVFQIQRRTQRKRSRTNRTLKVIPSYIEDHL